MLIRRYVHEDYPNVMGLISAVYNEDIYKKAVQRFQWQYEQNPNNTSQGPLIFVLEDNNKITGMIGTFAQKIKIGDSSYPACWVGDFMVHPGCRSGFNGTKLARTIIAQPGMMMGFPAKNTLKLWFRAGAMAFSELVEYTKTVRHFDRLISSFTAVRHYLECGNLIQIVDINQFDERFDRLWEKASKGYGAIQQRDSIFLNWRFFKCPYLTYQVLAAVKGDEILGYIIIRVGDSNKIKEGHVVDLFTERTDRLVLKTLMRAGIQVLNNNGCEVIKMTISSQERILNDFLLQCYFSPSVNNKRTGILINNMDKSLNPIIKEPGKWFLTKADSDIDFAL